VTVVVRVFDGADNRIGGSQQRTVGGPIRFSTIKLSSEKIRSPTPAVCWRPMSSVQEPHLHLEVGHILFLDIVGYSKLLVDEQKELIQELNQIVRETEQFRAAEAGGS
jgi:hypothetical protein